MPNRDIDDIFDAIDDQMKRQGFDDLSDMIMGNMRRSSGRRSSTVFSADSRFDYFINALNNVTYDYQYRGYYREAHDEAINKYIQLAYENQYDLTVLEKRVTAEIRLQKRNANKTKARQGYVDGLEFVKKELENSKIYILNKIANELR